MEFQVIGRHLEVTDSIEEYAKKKTDKLLRFYDRIQSIRVVIDRRDRDFDVEIILEIEKHDKLVAKNSTDDLYACIDAVSDKIERQLVDLKEKLRNRKHNV